MRLPGIFHKQPALRTALGGTLLLAAALTLSGCSRQAPSMKGTVEEDIGLLESYSKGAYEARQGGLQEMKKRRQKQDDRELLRTITDIDRTTSLRN